MPKRDSFETLQQMRGFALEARQLASDGSMERLKTDLGYRRHAERVAELIGESATRLPVELIADWPTVPWKQMIGMRNWLIHGYDGIDAEILWDVLNFRADELVGMLDQIIALHRF